MCIRSMSYFIALFKKNEAVAIYNVVIGLPELIHGSTVKLGHSMFIETLVMWLVLQP